MKIIRTWILITVGFLTGCAESPTEPRTTESKHPVFPNDPAYLSYQLSRFGLEELKKDGSIRFLWLRSFHSPIVFEIENRNAEEIGFTAKEWKNNKWTTFESKTLNTDDSPLVTTSQLYVFGFFEMPNFVKDDFKYTDGASWIFEAKIEEKHHWVWKQSPSEDSQVGRWGRSMIEASIDSPAVPIY